MIVYSDIHEDVRLQPADDGSIDVIVDGGHPPLDRMYGNTRVIVTTDCGHHVVECLDVYGCRSILYTNRVSFAHELYDVCEVKVGPDGDVFYIRMKMPEILA